MRTGIVAVASCVILLGACTAGADVVLPTDPPAPPAVTESEQVTPPPPASTTTFPVPSTDPPPGPAGWERLVTPPLSPRAGAVGVWTGREVLVMGGIPVAWCPPGADCAGIPDELSDGAAFDPASGAWRTIADSPLPLSYDVAAASGDDVLVLVHSFVDGGGGVLRYSIPDDRWEVMTTPIDEPGWYGLAAVDGGVVAYSQDTSFASGDLFFDASTDSWSELPADPFPPSFDRTIVVVGDTMHLFAQFIRDVRGGGPSLIHAAVLDEATGAWSEVAEPAILGYGPPLTVGREVIYPWPGGADGGEVDNWGRSYPYGGTFEVGANIWWALPEPAADDGFAIAGAVGPEDAGYVDAVGSVLDTTSDSWIRVPALPPHRGEVINRTVVAAGRDLFTFGGEVWRVGMDGSVLGDAYLWRPPG